MKANLCYLLCLLVLMAPPAARTENNPPRSDVQDRGQRQGGCRGRQVRAQGEEEEEGGEGEAEGEKDGAELLTGWSQLTHNYSQLLESPDRASGGGRAPENTHPLSPGRKRQCPRDASPQASGKLSPSVYIPTLGTSARSLCLIPTRWIRAGVPTLLPLLLPLLPEVRR